MAMTMPHDALDSGSAILLPAEVLVVATSHENREVERYRLMALRFLPFSPGVSRLMNMLALEGEQRLEKLAAAVEYLQLEAMPASASFREERVRDRHFFIVDERVATQVLSRTLIAEHQSLDCYRQLLKANGTPELDALIAACVEQKLAQGRVLQESQEHLLTAARQGYRRSA